MTMSESEAPGLRWWERLRIDLCVLGPACRWTWVGVTFGGIYSMVLNFCFLLLFRLLLQSVLLGCCVLVGGCAFLSYRIRQRLNLDYPTQQAKVIRTKTIPRTPQCEIPQKLYCWLEFLGDDDGTGSDSGGHEIAISVQNTNNDKLDLKDEENEEAEDDEGALDDKAWIHVPCVIAQEGQNRDGSLSPLFRKGDVVTVHLIDGDISRPIYVPYQWILLRRMRSRILSSVAGMVGALLALCFLFKGIPPVFANSQQLEDNLNSFADWFWSDDDGVGEDASSNDDTLACRIPWFVAAGYDAMLLIQIVIPASFIFYIQWKVKKLLEEAPADSYRLLQGGGDDDEEHDSAHGGDVNLSNSDDPPGSPLLSSSSAGIV